MEPLDLKNSPPDTLPSSTDFQAERWGSTSESSQVASLQGGSLERWQGPYWWNSLILGWIYWMVIVGLVMCDPVIQLSQKDV